MKKKKPVTERLKLKVQDGEGDANLIRVASVERYHQDDLEGECSKCHAPIFYRPEPPLLATFICLNCARPLLTSKNEIVISSKTARWLAGSGKP